MMRQIAGATQHPIFAGERTGPITLVNLQQMTVTLFGLTIYLFCVHSFKLPLASLGIAVGVLGVLSKAQDITLPAPLLFFAAFLAWCTFTGLASPYRIEVIDHVFDYAKILLIFFVAINAAKTVAELVIFMATWLLMFGLYPVRGTYLNFFAGINQFGRYGWNFSFSNYNDLAAYSMLALAMSAFLLAGRYEKWLRVSAFVGAGCLAIMVVLTQSRGAFIGLVIAFSFMAIRSRSRTKLIRFGMLAALGIALVAPGEVWERFSRMKYLFNTETLVDADSSAEQRYVLLQVALAVAKDNLATGVGLGAYSTAHGEYAEERVEWRFGRGNRDTHNMYLNLVAETGIFGAILFMGILVSTLLHAQRTEKALRTDFPVEAEQLRILRFGLIAYMIAAIFGTFHRSSFLYLYVAVTWCATDNFIRFRAGGAGRVGLLPAAAPQPMRNGARPGRTRTTLARLR